MIPRDFETIPSGLRIRFKRKLICLELLATSRTSVPRFQPTGKAWPLEASGALAGCAQPTPSPGSQRRDPPQTR
eukprot:3279817-Prymnesium_polylepis.1